MGQLVPQDTGKSWGKRNRHRAGGEGADPCKGDWCHGKEGGTAKLAQKRALQGHWWRGNTRARGPGLDGVWK